MLKDVVGEQAITVRLTPAALAKLKAIAKQERRSVGGQAAYIIEKALESETAAQP